MKHRVLDWIAGWMGVFDVDWDADFEDDGYRDPRGLAALDEPLWLSDLADRPSVQVVHTGGQAARQA